MCDISIITHTENFKVRKVPANQWFTPLWCQEMKQRPSFSANKLIPRCDTLFIFNYLFNFNFMCVNILPACI